METVKKAVGYIKSIHGVVLGIAAFAGIIVSSCANNGWLIQSPTEVVSELKAEVQTNTLRIDSLESNQRDTRVLLESMARGECIQRPEQEIQLMGLPCDALMNRRR